MGLIMDLIFDHIGIITTSLEKGRESLGALLPRLQWTRIFHDKHQQVAVQFAKDASGMIYEIISPEGDSSPVTNALANRKNLLNHIAYRVESLELAGEHLKKSSYRAITEPAQAAAFGGARIQFFLSDLDFLIELIEGPGHQHQFTP
jgi:methylmalonyl-CoA/ethylmalonyl-CoA epimerase